MSCAAEPRRPKPFKGRGPVKPPSSTVARIEAELRKREVGALSFEDFERLQGARDRALLAPLLLVQPNPHKPGLTGSPR